MSRLGALAAAALLASCGVKGDPLPPELVQPMPVERLSATAEPAGVLLRWRRPTHYSGGGRMRDLARFEIQRATVADEQVPYAVAGVLTLTDQQRFQQVDTLEWTDTTVAPDTPYLYRIVAVTTDGYRSPPSPAVLVRTHARGAPPDRSDAADPS